MCILSKINSKINNLFVKESYDVIAKNGCNKIIESIMNDVNKSNSVIIDDVECYLGDEQYYYQYLYKVKFTCINKQNTKIRFTMYFGYNYQNSSVYNFLSNSSKYDFAKKNGILQKIA